MNCCGFSNADRRDEGSGLVGSLVHATGRAEGCCSVSGSGLGRGRGEML